MQTILLTLLFGFSVRAQSQFTPPSPELITNGLHDVGCEVKNSLGENLRCEMPYMIRINPLTDLPQKLYLMMQDAVIPQRYPIEFQYKRASYDEICRSLGRTMVSGGLLVQGMRMDPYFNFSDRAGLAVYNRRDLVLIQDNPRMLSRWATSTSFGTEFPVIQILNCGPKI